MKTVVSLKLDKIAKRLMKVHGTGFEYDPKLIDTIASQCLTVETGARNIDSVIEQSLLPTISKTLISQLGSDVKQAYTKAKVGFNEEEGFSITFE
jgi:type VI secretion system protein VasG